MKSIILSLLLAASAYAADVRVVGTQSVDLTPVDNWIKHPEGDRPMKHWKQIRILSFDAASPTTFTTCSISVDGEEQTVIVKNLPQSILAFLSEEERLKEDVDSLQGQVDSQTKTLRSQQTQYYQEDPNSEFATNYLNAAANLDNEKDDLAKLKRKLLAYRIQGTKATTELAMFTGQMYGQKQIWDCGRKVSGK